jgi:hypothetical protein
MKKTTFLLMLLLLVAFVGCKKSNPGPTPYDLGYTEGLKVYNYTSVFYNSTTKQATIPTSITQIPVAYLPGLIDLYNNYKANSSNADWKSGFTAAVASGQLGVTGAASLVAWLDSSSTASILSGTAGL